MNRFLIASLAGAAALALSNQSAMAKPDMLQSTLSGAEETAGGAPDGSGSFTGSLDAGSGDLCYELKVAGIGEPTAAHIHAGAKGADGAPVATIEVTGDDGELCLAIPADAGQADRCRSFRLTTSMSTRSLPPTGRCAGSSTRRNDRGRCAAGCRSPRALNGDRGVLICVAVC
ncbi:MAG: CHRD domain-containing protein [Caenibius sp.]